MSGARAFSVTAAVATAAVIAVAAAQTPQPGGGRIQPQGERVEIPGAPECAVYVAAWKNGSWFDPETPPGQSPRSGEIADSSEARSDVQDITRWLVQLMEQSPDMAAKTKAACQASGTNFIQFGIVRDDPEAGPGAWVGGTPLIVIDTGDIERLAKNTESPGSGDESRERRARTQVGALLPVSLMAHETDHAMRARERSEFYTALQVVQRLPNITPEELAEQRKNEQKFREEFEQFAIDDENTVIRELDDFKHSGYSRTAYTDGKGGIPFVIDTIQVRVNAANALAKVEHTDHQHRYAELGAADLSSLEKTPTVTNRAAETTSLSNKNSDRLPDSYAFTEDDAYRLSLSISKSVRTYKAARHALDAADANVSKVNSASGTDRNQEAGGTVLQYIEHSVVLSDSSHAPRLRWAIGPAASVRALKASVRQGITRAALPHAAFRIPHSGTGAQPTGSAAPEVKAIFVATGRSSGAAFQMAMAYDGPGPLELVDPGFVLEPVQGVSASQAEREIANVKGRRVTATIDGYCLQMRKPPPAAGMVYRLAKNSVQGRHPQLAPIMIATKVLKENGELHPDIDPVQYFHTIRQWALWAHEQGWKTEAEFADAFVEHSKKNVAAAGRQWTTELDQSVRRLLPNRWRDISEVLKLALPPAGGR
jgi:hypothetical protein